MPVPGAEGSERRTVRGDRNLPITATEVQLGKEFGALELVKKVIDAGKGVGVLHSQFVESAVVDDKAESPILLGDKKNWRAPGRCTMTNKTLGQ